MTGLVVATFDWLPEFPRGYVRDIRLRWALEEAGLPYSVISVPFRKRNRSHFEHQPFGQVPWLVDGDITIFESGAAVLYIAEKNEKLLPADPKRRQEAVSWLFASLNSVEAASLPWFILQFTEDGGDSKDRAAIETFLASRLKHMERALAGREWLTDRFTAADIVMADVFRVIDRFDGLADYSECRRYMTHALQRPAFQKALSDQLAHFSESDLRETPGKSE